MNLLPTPLVLGGDHGAPNMGWKQKNVSHTADRNGQVERALFSERAQELIRRSKELNVGRSEGIDTVRLRQRIISKLIDEGKGMVRERERDNVLRMLSDACLTQILQYQMPITCTSKLIQINSCRTCYTNRILTQMMCIKIRTGAKFMDILCIP